MKIDVKQLFGDPQTVLAMVPNMKYNEIAIDVAKQLSGKKILYITMNKTNSALKETFKNKGIDVEKIVFIDAISRTISEGPMETKGVFFTSSPAALTELSITIHKQLDKKFDFIIFDSLSNLFVYQKKEPVIKFISVLANRLGESGSKTLFYALKIKEDETAIQQCSMYVDKVIDLGD